MKPFSSVYYIKENKKRALALIVLVATICTCYLGGVYITSPSDSINYSLEALEDYALISPTYEDTDARQYEASHMEAESLVSKGSLSGVFYVNADTFVDIKTTMGFAMNITMVTFNNSEGFAGLNNVTGLFDEDFVLKDGEVVISDAMARQIGLDVGDILKKEQEGLSNGNRDLKIAGIYDLKGVSCYAVDSTAALSSFMMIRSEKGEVSEFAELCDKFSKDFPLTYAWYLEYATEYIGNQLSFMNYIFLAIVAIVGLVLAITINATFLGAYEKRQYEFSVYKALGFGEREIFRKIAGEIMIINLIGFSIGIFLSLAAIYFLNNLMLYPEGLFLQYVNMQAVLASVICDIAIIIPVMLSKINKMKKLDITEY